MTPRPTPSRPRQPRRGAALLTAMIIVTVIATLSAGMVWQQWQAVQVESAERAQTQSQWILNGALDWARLILREDARSSGVDHLGEPWAVPLAESRLSTFLAAERDRTDDAPDAFFSGVIRDAQARYNLRNLVQDGKLQPAELKTLTQLCLSIGLGESLAQQLGNAFKQATPGTSIDVGGTATADTSSAMPILPPSVDELGWLGLDAATVARLRPYVTLLPVVTAVNLNTAPKEVIAAVLPGVDLSSAERLVQARLRNPLRTLEEARSLLGPAVELDARRVSINTRYFEVDGALRLEQTVVAQRSLLERQAQTRDVRVLRRTRLRADAMTGPGGGNPP